MSSYGNRHVISIETFGKKRRTIVNLAGMVGVTVGTPLPEGGWAYCIITPDGRTAAAESEFRDEAALHCCEELDIDPAGVLGRPAVGRARARMAARG